MIGSHIESVLASISVAHMLNGLQPDDLRRLLSVTPCEESADEQ